MSPVERELQKIKFQRFRTLRTSKPFCATCGERRWWVRYESHHIAGRTNSDELIRLCSNCHYGINILQTFTPKLDDSENPQLDRIISLLEGHGLIMEFGAVCLGETVTFLRGLRGQPQDQGEGA